MGQQSVQRPSLLQRNLMAGLRKLLKVVDPMLQRIVIVRTRPLHSMWRMSVLGIVLVPGVMQRLSRARECQAGCQMQLKSPNEQEMSKAAVVIASSLESDMHRAIQRMQILG